MVQASRAAIGPSELVPPLTKRDLGIDCNYRGHWTFFREMVVTALRALGIFDHIHLVSTRSSVPKTFCLRLKIFYGTCTACNHHHKFAVLDTQAAVIQSLLWGEPA